MGFEIDYSEVTKTVRNKKTGEDEETSICTDWYMTREFTDSELRLLIGRILFSKHIPYSQCTTLIEKLKGLLKDNLVEILERISINKKIYTEGK